MNENDPSGKSESAPHGGLDPSFLERPAWKPINGIWRLLHGGLSTAGVSLEWHDFHLNEDLDWGRSFHPGSMEICLNFSGKAHWQLSGRHHELGPEQVALYVIDGSTRQARRSSHSLHRFLTIELTADYLRQYFGDVSGSLIPTVRRFMETDKTDASFPVEIFPMPMSLLNLRLYIHQPPAATMAHAIWYQSKILEILSQLLFREERSPTAWPEKTRKESRDRLAKVLFLLERDYENPPTAEMLAAEIGCSVFHLSRLFTRQMGMSIPRFIRTRRIERAAELLRAGGRSVTEIAMMVGYSSLGSFNKAFVEQMGCCPGLYPHLKTPTVRQPSATA